MATDNNADLPQFKLNILAEIKTRQTQNGLKHGDYQRYRGYCTRALRRIRHSLKCGHGKGKYVAKPIEASQLTDVRYLILPLLKAERAWSYAMQLKQENTDGNARARLHLLKRLIKAVKWSSELESLCTRRGDSRTALEAEAYNAWMQGNLALEQEEWNNALEKFIQAHTVYTEMSKVGSFDEQELYRSRVEEIDPSIRYCQYKLNRADANSEDSIKLLQSMSSNPALDLLKAKIEGALQDSVREQAKTLSEATWRGRTVPISNEKLRMCIVSANDYVAEIETATTLDAKFALYDKIFSAYSDAMRHIRDDVKSSAGRGQEYEAQLQFLYTYISFLSLSRTMDRSELMVESTIEKLEGKQEGKASASDAVRIFDTLLQYVGEIQSLRGVDEDEELMADLEAKAMVYKAFRCFYLGETYAAAEKTGEAMALFSRADELSTAAIRYLGSLSSTTAKEDSKKLESLLEKIRRAKCVARAQQVLTDIHAQKQIDDHLRGMTITTSRTAQQPLLSRLGTFELEQPDSRAFIITFPPEFEPVPCKPVFFDIAINEHSLPDVAAPQKQKEPQAQPSPTAQQKKGWFGLW